MAGLGKRQLEDGSFDISQRQYLETIKEISIPRERRRAKHEATTEQEKSELRALHGALSWQVGQVGYKYSAHVSLSLSGPTQHSGASGTSQQTPLHH